MTESAIDPVVEPLVLDLVEWVAREPRDYADVMAAWRTSCPRLPVWETAVDRGWVIREHRPGAGAVVRVTEDGLVHLALAGRRPPPAAIRPLEIAR